MPGKARAGLEWLVRMPKFRRKPDGLPFDLMSRFRVIVMLPVGALPNFL
jgi:hypothetical protein